eukprot:PLAT15495.2.p1 GENE.PLAT15495.2~~PLAT15495.2.p1  ORF type:complete len:196 (-),score=96.33 PLAT15495.2:100-687(-)
MAMDARYATPSFVGYSLWLLPDDDTMAICSARQEALRAAHGGPAFGSHITLLPGLPLSDGETEQQLSTRVERDLVPLLTELDVSLLPAASGELFFHCVFFPVLLSDDLLAAAKLARATFSHDEATAYEPHISLLYQTMPAADAEAAAASVRAAVGDDALSTRLSRLALWKTEGEVKEWKRVGEWRLRRKEEEEDS